MVDVLVTIFHTLISFLLIIAVLLQSGKGGGLASSIGGGLSSSSVLGGRSASTFLTKTTAVLATVFMLSCLLQAVTYDSGDVPTSATERMLEESGFPSPSPLLNEGAGFLDEPATDETDSQGGEEAEGAEGSDAEGETAAEQSP